MRYLLMHKDIPVVELYLDELTGNILKVGELYASEHLPVGTTQKGGTADRASLSAWWLDRSIPASRSGVRNALEVLGLADTKVLLTRCFGLSLSDAYWIKPDQGDLTWARVNFFENPFSEDVGDALFGHPTAKADFDFSSPDNTSDGFLQKRWKIIEGKRCLIKAGSRPFLQQPFNEVIASKIAERLGIPHVEYRLIWDGDVPYSVCEDFISADTELVSAWRVMQTRKKGNSTSVYRHYLDTCNAIGAGDMTLAVDQMIVLDFLIANEDRHQNNFGLVRYANTLEWLGAAPIYDSGSSLGYDKLTGQIKPFQGIECKPFKKSHLEQLKLVTSFRWLDLTALIGAEEDILETFADAGAYIDDTRQQAIVSSFRQRVDYLADLIQKNAAAKDDLSMDVAEDLKKEYS